MCVCFAASLRRAGGGFFRFSFVGDFCASVPIRAAATSYLLLLLLTMPIMPSQPPSQWPSLRKRSRSLATDMYAEFVGDALTAAVKLIPEAKPGVPSLKARPCTRTE